MSNNICPICANQLLLGCRSWHYQCSQCGYEKGNLQTQINVDSAHQLIDENARKTVLKDLRIPNFAKLVTEIKSLKYGGGRLLEVGCGYGWFLETAKSDFEVLGLEPDRAVCDAAASRGLPVRNGYFPDALQENEFVDVMVFNDVIEHIPDIDGVLKHCYQHLCKGGVLVLNLPSSRGVIYRISKKLCALGFSLFFERLWQKDFPSPHVHYFNLQNLSRLLKTKGFDSIITGNLPTLRLKGLYTRISYAGENIAIVNILVYLGLVLLLPIMKILPSDIIYVIAKRVSSEIQDERDVNAPK